MLCPYLYGRQFRININSGYTRMMGVIRWERSVGECGIIDLDFIIPIQPETI